MASVSRSAAIDPSAANTPGPTSNAEEWNDPAPSLPDPKASDASESDASDAAPPSSAYSSGVLGERGRPAAAPRRSAS